MIYKVEDVPQGGKLLLMILRAGDEEEVRIKGMDGDYLSVTPDDVELYDYRWNGVSIKAQTSSKVIGRLKGN